MKIAMIAAVAAFALNGSVAFFDAKPAPQQAPQVLQDKPAFDTEKARDEVVQKAWDFLKTKYNQPSPPDDKKGILSGWGPKSYNIPYTAMVLQGLYGTKAWDASNEMIRDSVNFLVENQESTGAFSYAPLSVMPKAKGMRAVYITAICVQLFVDLNVAEGAFKGKLTNNIALARDYLKQSQVGAADGPAPDYKENQTGYGGWAYSKEEIDDSVKAKGKPPSNMSTSTFAIDALKACGVKEDDPMWEAALKFLKRNQNAGEVQEEGFEAMATVKGEDGSTQRKPLKMAEKGSPDHGGAIYSEETSMVDDHQKNADGTVTLFSYGSMTYNLLRAYMFAGLKKDSVAVKLAYGWIQRNYTVERVPGFRNEKDFEMGLYYYYMSMSRSLKAWGEDTVEEPERGLQHNWREDMVKALQTRQKADGSWVNEKSDRWQENSGVLCTAYALDALRHTRK